MSRFSSVLFFGAAFALSGLSAPLAFAQPNAVAMPVISASQVAAGAIRPASLRVPAVQAANTCFTEDLVPDDNSSMLTVCGANGPSKVIFAQ